MFIFTTLYEASVTMQLATISKINQKMLRAILISEPKYGKILDVFGKMKFPHCEVPNSKYYEIVQSNKDF